MTRRPMPAWYHRIVADRRRAVARRPRVWFNGQELNGVRSIEIR